MYEDFVIFIHNENDEIPNLLIIVLCAKSKLNLMQVNHHNNKYYYE